METCFKKVTGVFGDYSEQHMVDCAYNADVGANGCSGAHPAAYPKWLNMTEGLLSEEDYPYQNSNPSLVCPADIGQRDTDMELFAFIQSCYGLKVFSQF